MLHVTGRGEKSHLVGKYTSPRKRLSNSFIFHAAKAKCIVVEYDMAGGFITFGLWSVKEVLEHSLHLLMYNMQKKVPTSIVHSVSMGP